jgi:hypothetical protein
MGGRAPAAVGTLVPCRRGSGFAGNTNPSFWMLSKTATGRRDFGLSNGAAGAHHSGAMITWNERQHATMREAHDDESGQHGSRTVLLVVGPYLPNSELRRYCLGALSAGRPVALVRLRPVPASERYLLKALARWYGHDSVRLIESHADWAAVSREATVVVLSDRGIWRDDDRVADSSEVRSLSKAAIESLYTETADRAEEAMRR